MRPSLDFLETRFNAPQIGASVNFSTPLVPVCCRITSRTRALREPLSWCQIMSKVEELAVVKVPGGGPDIRCFSLSANGVTASVCSVGASITNLFVPNFADPSKEPNDVVLGYKSPADLYLSKNPPYLCVVVGRFANRIAKGRFSLNNETYQLAINNPPNHLHGGNEGFSHKIWDAEMVENGVKFTLESQDGDQDYPGTIKAEATYSLVPKDSGAALCLQMEAKLLDDKKASPISLAQHSYFNLSSHDAAAGILDHRLTMPSCKAYTPVDSTSIPTREVRSLDTDAVMDWRQGRNVGDALATFGKQTGLSEDEVAMHLQAATPRCAPDNLALAGGQGSNPGEPYGFDHNYVIDKKGAETDGLAVAGIVEHAETSRRMKVLTSAPGVQLYTANYLDGSNAEISKNGTAYPQWQALCLETQTFPDGIRPDDDPSSEFSKGKCFILQPGGESYQHRVEYIFESMS